jgi:HlyD family secretion protein
MAQELFRKSALEKLSSPEQLDQLFTLADPKSWVALAALMGMLAAVVLWGIFGTVPTKIGGQGILIRNGGVFDVVATGSGILKEMPPLKSGDEVRKDQVIGRIAQPLLAQKSNWRKKAWRTPSASATGWRGSSMTICACKSNPWSNSGPPSYRRRRPSGNSSRPWKRA